MGNNKKTYLILGMFAIIFTFFGGSLAYWQWNTSEEQQTMVTFSTTADFSCAVDGGGDITNNDVDLAPADCTNEKYAIKRIVKVMPTLNTDKTNLTMDLWLDIESIGTGLSGSQNFRYALTTESDSCKTGVVKSGTFTGKSANQKVEIMNDKIYSQTYTDTYYLYVWLDKEETSDSTMDQEFSLSLNGSCTNSSKGEPYYVVYSADDTSLRFYKEEEGEIVEGEQYEDRTVTNVYKAYENDVYTSEAARPWNGVKTSTTKIVIEDEISPISTSYWFGSFTKTSSVDVTKLNTSNVIDMSRMFDRTGYDSTVTNFSITGLDGWNTSKVENMRTMFQMTGYYATTWSIGNLSAWNTSSVTNFLATFNRAGYKAQTFDIGKLDNWNVSNVTTMQAMFQIAGYKAQTFDIGKLDNWNVSKVTTMNCMFNKAGYSVETFDIGNLSNWNTSQVIDMKGLFSESGRDATIWNIGDLSNWDVSKVTDMNNMFFRSEVDEDNVCSNKEITFNVGNLSKWDTSNVTDMSGMFQCVGYSATTFNIGDLDNWDVSSVVNMRAMFYNAGYNSTTFDIGDLSGWDVSNVTTMRVMFYQTGYNSTIFDIGDLSGWDVSRVVDMAGMFTRCGLDENNNCLNKETIFNIGDLSKWDVSNVENMMIMFQCAGYNSTTFNIGDLSEWNTSQVTNMKSMFKNAGYNDTDFSQDLSGWIVPLVTTYTSFNFGVEDKVIAPVWVNENVDTE